MIKKKKFLKKKILLKNKLQSIINLKRKKYKQLKLLKNNLKFYNLKLKNLSKDYKFLKNYKILNFKILYKKKLLYINLFKIFYNLLVWIIFLNSTKNFKLYNLRKKKFLNLKFLRNKSKILNLKILRNRRKFSKFKKLKFLKKNKSKLKKKIYKNFSNNLSFLKKFYKKKIKEINKVPLNFNKNFLFYDKIFLKELFNLVNFFCLLKYRYFFLTLKKNNLKLKKNIYIFKYLFYNINKMKKIYNLLFWLKKIKKNDRVLNFSKRDISSLPKDLKYSKKKMEYVLNILDLYISFVKKEKFSKFLQKQIRDSIQYWFFIKKNYFFKKLIIYKNFLKNDKKLKNFFNYNFLEKIKFKKLFFKKFFNFKLKKIKIKNYKKKKKFFWQRKKIKKKINVYLQKILKNNVIKKNFLNNNIVQKQRYFFYDYFLFNNNINKKNIIINILWKKKINKSFFRFRLTEYMFLFLNNINNVYLIKKKIFYILNFYKILIILKDNLKLLKKNIIKNSFFLKNKKKIKYYLKREYFFQNYLYKNKGKILIRYLNILKYFNKFFNFFFFNLSLKKIQIIKKFRNYIYLSYIINISMNESKIISILSMNNYFLQKAQNSFIYSCFIYDRILNYTNVLNTISKKNLYWNFLSNIKSFEKKKIKKAFIMLPSIYLNKFAQYTYFVGKRSVYNFENSYNDNLRKYQYIYSLIFLLYILKKSKYIYFNLKKKYYKNFFFSFLKKTEKNYTNIYNKLYIKFLLLIKFFFYKNLNYLNFYKKKIQLHLLKKKYIYLLLLINIYIYLLISKILKLKILNNFSNYFIFFFDKNLNYLKNFKFLNKYKILSKKNYFKNFYNLKNLKYKFKNFFLNVKDNYYTKYSKYNKRNNFKCILHFIEKKTNNFLILSLLKKKKVIGHTSAGQGMYRAYNNSKRQKKGTRVLTKIIFRKLRLRARKYKLKEVFIKANFYWNFRINLLTKYWVLRYKLGIPHLKGVKVGVGLPFHKGLRQYKRKRK